MNDKTPETVVQAEPKPSLKDRIKQSNITTKAKNIAAVVGVVTVVVAVVAVATKKSGASVDVTLPDVDITTKDA